MEKEKQTKELEIALTTYIAMEANQDECSGFIDGFKEAMKLINKDSVLHSINRWATIDEKPNKYGKYFVRRKDGKVHWETWNGSGWAYNGNSITHWSEIIMPCD